MNRSTSFRLLALFLALGCVSAPVALASGPATLDYQEQSDFLPQTPGVTGGAVGAWFNPAAWATGERAEMALWWDDLDVRDDELDNWGFSLGRNLGFSVATHTYGFSVQTDEGEVTLPSLRVHDFQLGLAGGDRANHFGASWRWSTGDGERLGRESGLALGTIHRPNPNLSVGLSGFLADGIRPREGILDMGVRPLGRAWLSLFGDYSLREGQNLGEGRWGAGVEVRPTPGLHVGVRFREATGKDDYRYALNIGLTFDEGGYHVLPRYTEDGDRVSTTHLLRVHTPYRGLPLSRIVRSQRKPNRVAVLNLEKKHLTYQRAQWFDEQNVAWIDLARHLDDIAAEPSVVGVAVNLSGFSSRPSLLWEFREKLSDLHAAGKEIYVHADRMTIGTLYLASVGDRVTLDPEGEIMIPGLALHRTYMKGALDKLGIGVEEWRFFRYKTAMQGFAREDMSEGDREQIGRVVDVLYETWRDGVCRGRNLPHEAFDRIVDDDPLMTATTARARGLVDDIARWPDLEEWVKTERHAGFAALPDDARHRAWPDERWGRPPTVAVVYALGECAMDSGIRGRATSAYLRRLAKDPGVAAVVLRADSPGGDPLPSDLVAEGLVKNKEAGKAVIVSQGDVAASGGYWISMDADEILTTPMTITGSIGVIAGWFWDNGLGDKTGFNADGVQRGKHADLFTGIRFPVLGGPLPERNLTDEEKEYVKKTILELYGGFMGRVSEARGLSLERVGEIAQGRVWMGGDALEIGLVDSVGTLQDAIARARDLAGLDPDDEVLLVEYPPRELFQMPKLIPDVPGLRAVAMKLFGGAPRVLAAEEELSYEVRYLQRLAASPARPVAITPPEALPEGWGSER